MFKVLDFNGLKIKFQFALSGFLVYRVNWGPQTPIRVLRNSLLGSKVLGVYCYNSK